MPGYGLYLVRVPVSLLPGPDSVKGKGASVTLNAKHRLTPDLLASTFRSVLVLDAAYYLMDAVTRRADPCYRWRTGLDPLPGELPYAAGQLPPYKFAPDGPPAMMAVPGMNVSAGLGPGGGTSSTELPLIFSVDEIDLIVDEVRLDRIAWYRHDPSVVSWLIKELGTTQAMMREQARTGNPLFQPDV